MRPDCRKCGSTNWKLRGTKRYCGDCALRRANTWKKNNPGKRKDILARYYTSKTEKIRDYYYRHNYGITLGQYNDMVMAQCGLCAVCGEPETKKQASRDEYRLSVHHDHATGEVIALVCANCNRGMGLLKDSSNLLKRAAELQQGR